MLLALRAPECLNMEKTKNPLPIKEMMPPSKALNPLWGDTKSQPPATISVTRHWIFKNFKARGLPIANKLVTL